jgi:hypothetical protein
MLEGQSSVGNGTCDLAGDLGHRTIADEKEHIDSMWDPRSPKGSAIDLRWV